MGKKRLGDLYRTSVTVECRDHETDDSITVALVKISRPDTEAAVIASNAKRARLLMRREDKDSDVWLEAYGDIADRPREELVEVLISDDLAQKRLSAEAEEESQEKWSNDEYLDSLRTAWEDDGLNMTWASDPEDPDAKRVYQELTNFREAVEKRMQGEAEDLAENYSHLDLEDLRAKVVVKLIENAGNLVWINEFEAQRIFFATREPLDKQKRYFRHVDEVKDLDGRIFSLLKEKYDNLTVDVASGKESPATPGSSPQSEPSAEEEPPPASGPETSNASRTSPTSS